MSIPTDYGNRLTSFASPVDQTITSVKEEHLTRKELQLIRIAVDRSGDDMAEDAYFRALMGSAPNSGQLDEWIMSEIFSPQHLSERKAGQLATSLESLPEKLGFNNTFALVLYGYKLTTTLQEECQEASQRDNLKRAESLFASKLCEWSYNPRYKNIDLTALQFKPEQITPTFLSELKEKQLQAQRWASYTKTALITLGALGTALSIAGLIYSFTPKGIALGNDGSDKHTSPDASKKIDDFLKKDEPGSQSWSMPQVIGTTLVGIAVLGVLGLKRCFDHYAHKIEQARIEKLNDFMTLSTKIEHDPLWDKDCTGDGDGVKKDLFQEQLTNSQKPKEIEKTVDEESEEEYTPEQDSSASSRGPIPTFNIEDFTTQTQGPPQASKANLIQKKSSTKCLPTESPEQENCYKELNGYLNSVNIDQKLSQISNFLSRNRKDIWIFIRKDHNSNIFNALEKLNICFKRLPRSKNMKKTSIKENLIKKIDFLLQYAMNSKKKDLDDAVPHPPEFEQTFLWDSDWNEDDWLTKAQDLYRTERLKDTEKEKVKEIEKTEAEEREEERAEQQYLEALVNTIKRSVHDTSTTFMNHLKQIKGNNDHS